MAPPRKQADNRENKHFPIASGGSCLLEKVRISQDRGVGKKVRSWEGEIKPGQRRGKEGGKLGR